MRRMTYANFARIPSTFSYRHNRLAQIALIAVAIVLILLLIFARNLTMGIIIGATIAYALQRNCTDATDSVQQTPYQRSFTPQ